MEQGPSPLGLGTGAAPARVSRQGGAGCALLAPRMVCAFGTWGWGSPLALAQRLRMDKVGAPLLVLLDRHVIIRFDHLPDRVAKHGRGAGEVPARGWRLEVLGSPYRPNHVGKEAHARPHGHDMHDLRAQGGLRERAPDLRQEHERTGGGARDPWPEHPQPFLQYGHKLGIAGGKINVIDVIHRAPFAHLQIRPLEAEDPLAAPLGQVLRRLHLAHIPLPHRHPHPGFQQEANLKPAGPPETR